MRPVSGVCALDTSTTIQLYMNMYYIMYMTCAQLSCTNAQRSVSQRYSVVGYSYTYSTVTVQL